MLLETAGGVRAQAGEILAASARLREALSLFRSLDATGHAERVEQTLAQGSELRQHAQE